ncbi:alpha-hydroxy-acid oxidizing protein [Streptomyces sp. NPDC091972]|uniref:alpha-hydroxy-acid oxidizing protein n=1 Tax=Streptomyces sp. NPDC091972 TaxID=3366007 RepID=UPI003813AF77
MTDLGPLSEWAEKTWSEPVRTMIQDGAGTNATVVRNQSAWLNWVLRTRVLVDVSNIDTAVSVLGRTLSAPVLVAPSGLHTLAHPRGEVATAEGAASFGTTMVLSSGTGTPMEDVFAVGGPTWFQFYWRRDRGALREILARAAEHGAEALCLTADLPVRPLLGERMRHAVGNLPGGPPLYVLDRSAHVTGGEWDHDARVTWKDLDWLRDVTELPLVIKGITTAEDAIKAADCGVDAVIVSNHGGRAVDHGRPTAACLTEVVNALNTRSHAPEILVDGGIRHGRDVLIALALGARAVLVGRPILWGLAANGAEGVRDVLDFLRRQLESCMGMTGCSSVQEINRTTITEAQQ